MYTALYMGSIDVVIDRESVMNDVYVPYLEEMARTQIYYGGSSSGKSVFLAQRAVIDLLNGGRNYLICRAVGTSIRTSVFNEIQSVIKEWGVGQLFNENLSNFTITCANDYQMIFRGLDDVQKIKSIKPVKGVITDIWIEEATEVRKIEDIKELYKRQRGGSGEYPKRLTISFNPILKSHFIFQEFFAKVGWREDQTTYKAKDLSILKTWYVHNKFLTQGDIDDLIGEEDDYYRSVYTFGNWGILGDVIFTNWQVQDLSGMHDQFVNRKHGLDFGFSNDPAAMPCTHYDRKHKIIYIYDELYAYGLTNDLLADEVKLKIGDDYVICDSAEPKSIAELQGFGVNAIGAKKGKDSVNFGIDWLKRQTIIVDSSCINAQNEFQLYQWKKDKYGNTLRIPNDRDNHIIDPLRYAYEDEALYMPAFL